MTGLAGKAVIITGAGRGIGAATARALAAMGARVLVNDIDTGAAEACAAEICASGGNAAANAADISDWNQAGEMVQVCLERFGAIDGLVNNAAVFGMARLDELDRDSLQRPLAVNVIGAANCSAHAVKPMLARGRGAIVNIVSGAQMGIPAMGVYGATKGAVASLTYCWAMELQGKGVRVNAVSPLAMSEMARVSQAYQQSHGNFGTTVPSVQPEANWAPIAFLLSDAARDVTGQIVRIEGEQLSLVGHPAVMLPVRHRQGGWTYDAVCEAFESDLGKRQSPLGITGAEIARYGSPSAYWAGETKG